jgi:serine/threonine protein phosphatase PrpC
MPISPDSAAPPAYQLPDPPVFSAVSTAGQAPWHLPVSAAPNGLAADAARLGDLEVRAASMVGAGHRCQEPAGPRQDAYALGRTPDGQFLVIAVADGVSQSPRSDLGARVAVSAATRELVEMLSAGGITAIDKARLYNAVAGEMLGTGRNRGLPDEDICSILIVAVIPAVSRGDGMRQIWTSWIGDVSLWVHHDGILQRLTGREKTGLDRNTLTAVLPFNPDWAEELRFNLEPSDRVAILTDGLSDSLSGIPEAAEFFARQWAGSVPHPAAFLHSLCYDGPGQTDDRTAVVVWCSPPRLSGPTRRAEADEATVRAGRRL